MLPKTEATLHSFYTLNESSFKLAAKDFKPIKSSSLEGDYSPYGNFEDMVLVYQLMYSLYLSVDGNLFRVHYPNAYSTPLQIIKEIQEKRRHIESTIMALTHLESKYENLPKGSPSYPTNTSNKIPVPLYATLNDYKKTLEVLDYVLDLEEIRDELKPNQVTSLQKELDELKFGIYWKSHFRNLATKFISYILLIVVPVILSLIYNSTIKWIGIIAIIVPFVDSYFNKENMFDWFKILLNKSFKSNAKKIAFDEWKSLN